MRKTLTVLAVLATAASLAACKPFWAHDDKPAAAAAATPEPGATEPVQTTEAAKPEQTASTDKPMSSDKPEAPPATATK